MYIKINALFFCSFVIQLSVNKVIKKSLKMKKLILCIMFLVFGFPSFSQTDKNSIIDTSKANFNPYIFLSFDQVKNKKLRLSPVRFYSINEYKKIFSINLNSYLKIDDQFMFLSNYSQLSGNLHYKPFSQPNNRNFNFNNYPENYYDYFSPWNSNSFSDALIGGSLNFIIYQLFYKNK